MNTITNNSKRESDFFLQEKSLSVNTFPQNKQHDILSENLYRSIRFLPKNFCPKPKLAIISLSPMILSNRPHLRMKKISIGAKHNELPISCEECSSDCDSDEEGEGTSPRGGSLMNNKNTITSSDVIDINNIRRILSRIRNQSYINVSKDDIKVYLKTKYCLPIEDKLKCHSIDLQNRIEHKGYSILNILELSPKDVSP